MVHVALREIEALGATILQVKEKFGGLRIYFDAPEDIRGECVAIVEAVEAECAKSCECCGTDKDVTCVGPGWRKTLCGYCRGYFDFDKELQSSTDKRGQ